MALMVVTITVKIPVIVAVTHNALLFASISIIFKSTIITPLPSLAALAPHSSQPDG